jgi:hypothetical protein
MDLSITQSQDCKHKTKEGDEQPIEKQEYSQIVNNGVNHDDNGGQCWEYPEVEEGLHNYHQNDDAHDEAAEGVEGAKSYLGIDVDQTHKDVSHVCVVPDVK